MSKYEGGIEEMKLKRFITLVLFLIMIISLFSLCTDSKNQEPYEKAIITARNEIWKAITNGKASSASVAIMDNGKMVYSEGFGMADWEQSISVTRDTLYNIGSVSKTFCATAMMLLVDDQKVDLDHKVTEYIPEFIMADPRYKDITVRMLLNHTSGLPGTSYANVMGYKFHTEVDKELIEKLKTANLKHTPNEMAIYCNDGFTLAEMIIERVSGESYIGFLEERIFKPLSMKHSGLSIGEQKGKAEIAGYYAPNTGKHYPAEVLSVYGAGGLSMSAEDLCRFGDSFSGKGKKILSDSSLAEMRKEQPSLFNENVKKEDLFLPYGLGWDCTNLSEFQKQGIQLLGKGGNTSNFSSFLAIIPEKRISVAVTLSGLSSAATDAVINIIKALLEEKGIMKTESPLASKPVVSEKIPDTLSADQGLWIGGEGLARFNFDRVNNTITISSVKGVKETPRVVLIYNQGFFYDQLGAKYGLLEVKGKEYFISYQMVSGILLQKALPEGEGEVRQLKIDIHNQKWLRRNVKSYEVLESSGSRLVTSSNIDALPGYIDFIGIKKVQGPDFAAIAGTALRDQTELFLFEKEGDTWARVSDMILSPVSSAKNAVEGENLLIIGKDGYNKWLNIVKEGVLSFKNPPEGRIILYSPDEAVLYDNIVDSGEVYVPAGSLMEAAGEVGEIFNVTIKQYK
jgi:CubicO group peptidase (beta-lactamase class C family)